MVQGLTEFLPISSSGHLVLAPKLLGFNDPGLDVDAFLHLGTLLAAVFYFRQEIIAMLTSKRKLLGSIILATLPVVIIGFSYKDFFASALVRSTDAIAITLIVGSVLMFVADKYITKKAQSSKLKVQSSLSMIDIFAIGVFQTLALFPGLSRSGATIAAGLFIGLKRDEAAKFSFIVGLPAITGAGLLAIKDLLGSGSIQDLNLQVLLVGLVVSFITGYYAIDFMIKFLKNNSLISFVIYRLVLALIIFLYL